MANEKRWRLVCYDVRDDKRYRAVYKIVRGAGERVQYSVFRCRLDDREAERLRWRLAQVMDPVDALLIVDLCPRCATNVVTRNHVEGWTEEPPTFRIIGRRPTLAPPASVRPADQGSKPVASAAGHAGRKSDEDPGEHGD